MKKTLFAALMLLLLTTFTKAQTYSDFTLPDVDGNDVTLSQVMDKGHALISFWATWCSQCKEEMKKMYTFFYSGVKVPFYEIKPLAIKVYGDFAFADYNYFMFMETPDGKKKSEKGSWTDIQMKQGT